MNCSHIHPYIFTMYTKCLHAIYNLGIYIYIYIYIKVWEEVYVCTFIFVFTKEVLNVLCVYKHIYIYICLYTHIHIYTKYLHAIYNLYICMFPFIFVCTKNVVQEVKWIDFLYALTRAC